MLKTVNKYCKEYKPIIDTLGIIAGLIILILTYVNINIIKEQYEYDKEKNYIQSLPIAKFIVDTKRITVRLLSKEMNPQFYEMYLPGMKRKYYITPPKYSIDISHFVKSINSFYLKEIGLFENINYSDENNPMPFSMKIYYEDKGIRKIYCGLYTCQHSIIKKGNDAKIQIISIHLIDNIFNEKQFKIAADKYYDATLFMIKRSLEKEFQKKLEEINK